MSRDADLADGAVSLLGRRLGPSFRLRLVVVGPGQARAYDEAEWRDALVVVEHGEIELEGATIGALRFERGDVLMLVGLPLRALHNRGREPALLAAVSRAPMSCASPARPSVQGTDPEEMQAT
jgi:hypothetical protein